MGVVAGDHKAPRHRPAVVLPVKAQTGVQPLEHIPQEGGAGALLGAGAHLLVVEAGVHGDAVVILPLDHGLQGRVGALQVVQLGGGDELLRRPPDGGGGAAVEVHVGAQDGLLLHAQLLRQEPAVAVLPALPGGEQGQHVHLLVVGGPVVHIPVHVDGHAGDDEQIPVKGQEAGGDGASLPHQHTSGQGQGTVHPGGADHPAVALRVQLQVTALSLHLRHLLHLEGGGVAVGGGHLEMVVVQLSPHAEGDEGGAVAGGVVGPALLHRPFFRLPQPLETGGLQLPADLRHGVEAAGTPLNKVQNLSCSFLVHNFHLLISPAPAS